MGVMIIFAFVLLFLAMGLAISIPIRAFIKLTKLMKNSPNSDWTRDRIRSCLHLAPRPHSPYPDLNLQNPNRDKPSKPKQQMYFEYTDHGLSCRYQPEIEHLLQRTACRVELEVAWLMDGNGINGARTGSAGGRACYIVKFQDKVDRVTGHNDYLEITLCGYASETRYIGRCHVLYFVDWTAYKPAMFIKSVRFLED